MNVEISDITLRISEQFSAAGLSFKEKLEIAKLLEKLRVDVIETCDPCKSPVDKVAVSAIADTINASVISVPVGLDMEGIKRAREAIAKAKRPRLNLIVPTSTVRMEYVYQLKADSMLLRFDEHIALCTRLCDDVEFTAEDATRSEPQFLDRMISLAVARGVKTVTLCDSAGLLLPDECQEWVKGIRERVPELQNVRLGLQCSDKLGLAAADAITCARNGVTGIRGTFNGVGACLSTEQFVRTLMARADALDFEININTTELQRICKQLESLLGMDRAGRSAFSRAMGASEAEKRAEGETNLTADSDILAVRRKVEALGYELNDADMGRVYQQVKYLAAQKRVDTRDLEALVAELARQVAPTYQLVNYVINSGNAITATACIRLEKHGRSLQAVSVGDGPIDAAFLALEQMIGHHYELDDFQIQAVTEGREAMGDALVKLRYNARIYPGHGLSTDIIGASIKAYLNAVNKLIHEEQLV